MSNYFFRDHFFPGTNHVNSNASKIILILSLSKKHEVEFLLYVFDKYSLIMSFASVSCCGSTKIVLSLSNAMIGPVFKEPNTSF